MLQVTQMEGRAARSACGLSSPLCFLEIVSNKVEFSTSYCFAEKSQPHIAMINLPIALLLGSLYISLTTAFPTPSSLNDLIHIEITTRSFWAGDFIAFDIPLNSCQSLRGHNPGNQNLAFRNVGTFSLPEGVECQLF